FLVLLLADADDLVEYLLGGCGATAGRVDVEDDGFDGGVVAEPADLVVDLVGIDDDAVEVDDADLGGSEAVDGGGGVAIEAAHGGPYHGCDEQGYGCEGASDDG